MFLVSIVGKNVCVLGEARFEYGIWDVGVVMVLLGCMLVCVFWVEVGCSVSRLMSVVRDVVMWIMGFFWW